MEIISDIMTNELNHEVSYSTSEYTNWQYAFTINKKINSKKLIESIAASSPYLIRFNKKY